jgi:translocation and assembly module TamB
LKTHSKVWMGGMLLIVVAAAVAVGVVLETNVAEPWVRNMLVRQIEQATGAHVQMDRFHLDIRRLRFEIDGLTLRGLEAASEPPLFRAERVELGIRILSFFRREIALDELIVDRPQAFVRVDKNGRSNIPSPQHASNRPWRDTLFSLRVGRLEVHEGIASLNDQHIPLAIQGRNLEFDLRYYPGSSATESYVGNFRLQQAELRLRRDLPFRFDISTKFTLHPGSFEVDELICKLPHSDLNLRAELASFARPDWTLHYRGSLSLTDIRTILREPTTPDGIADFSGQAHYGADQDEWTAGGYFKGHDIGMAYTYFHAKGLEAWGDYEVAKTKLTVPNLNVRALGGALDGQLEMDFHGYKFRTKTHMHGADLNTTLADVNDNDTLPTAALHWTAGMDVDSVNTWDRNFIHFRTVGQSRWSPPQEPTPGLIPATAQMDFEYVNDTSVLSLTNADISTPSMQVRADGTLSAKDSTMEVDFRADDLRKWHDFIHMVEGADTADHQIAGKAAWKGRILGPLLGSTFAGHMHATEMRYDSLYWDDIDGDMEYSPDGFRLSKTVVRRGRTSADLDLSLMFDGNWNFLASNPWSLTARIDRAPSEDLQTMFGVNYPVKGFLSGDVRGSGTRGDPMFDSNFTFDDIEAAGFRFDRLSGQLHAEADEIRLSRAELRKNSERIEGDFLYHPKKQDAVFEATGTGIPLETIPQLQNGSLGIGGQMEFTLRGSGPLRAPVAQADLRVVNLKLGKEVEGNFNGQLSSDGQSARLALTSDLTHGKLQGDVTVGFSGDQMISGKLTVTQFDLDPLIVAGLHLQQLTGHSNADGVFTISGALRQPDSIELTADLTRIAFDYEFVQLTNDQDIQLTYRRNEVRIGQARIHGTDTDFQLSGSARFDRDRPLRFALSGGVNLRLLKALFPDLVAQGRADANVSIEGTMSRPRITGRASVKDVSANYADFPTGLSKMNGDLVFDKNRLVFDRITAESGGGQLALSGSVTYGEGPMRYEVNATTPQVRIRYPAGMSWLAGGTLQLSGTSTAAVLSGRVQVQRLLFAEGVDVASFFAASSDTSAETTSSSPFLQHLAFDVEGQTNTGARIEWSGAQIEIDGNVRLRGTWDRPVLLGDLHLLGGQMPFRGNTYQLTRGDINFANPFRLDPILNVEATSVISQYQVTIDFSGPASHLALNYRSDPPLPDSDIIALLALGNTGESSGLRSASASQNYGATALLSEAISSGLGGRIEHLFGISQFRVDPFVAGTATESNAAARITIQQQVKNNLTITYSTNAATSNQYQLIQVEYAVKRDLSIVFLRDINGTNGLDIKWVKHFK